MTGDRIADIHARIAATVHTDPRTALQVLLDEEGPEALIEAVLDAERQVEDST